MIGPTTNPYVFIVGCPRSGTTLLQRMVSAHPRIAIAYEAHWIPKFFERHRGVTREGLVTEELIPLLLTERTFIRMHIGREQLSTLVDQGRPISYSSFVTGVLDLYGRAKGKPLVGDKWPNYVLRINAVNALWPGARFVHLIRDGRDVGSSLMEWRSPRKYVADLHTWKEDAASTAAVFWESNVRRGREGGKSLGSKLYYEMRYESLLARPLEECEALCDFLKVSFDEAMVRFYETRPKTSSEPGKDHHPWMPITPGLRDWRTQMPAEDVERFEAAAGQLLDELGYARAAPHPRPESLQHAAKIRDLLAGDPMWAKRFGLRGANAVSEKVVA
jgi:sulfotransferase family protein